MSLHIFGCRVRNHEIEQLDAHERVEMIALDGAKLYSIVALGDSGDGPFGYELRKQTRAG